MTSNQLEIVNKVVASNPIQYNFMKALEEMSELSEVLLKKMNKKGTAKEPSNQEIIDEISDVLMRTQGLAIIFGEEAVEARLNSKLAKLDQYIAEGKYKGRV